MHVCKQRRQLSADLPFRLKFLDCTNEKTFNSSFSLILVTNLRFSDDKKKLIVKILCNVEAKAKYEMLGSILLLRMEGNGDVFVALSKFITIAFYRLAVFVIFGYLMVTGKNV